MAHIQWRVGDKNTMHDRDQPTTNKQNEFTKCSVAGENVDTGRLESAMHMEHNQHP